VEQAMDFCGAAQSANVVASRPLLFYYSFMNLAKAFCLSAGPRNTFAAATHGLRERLRAPRRELLDAYLEAEQSTAGRLSNFDELLRAVSGVGLTSRVNLRLPALLPQVVAGHRLWADAVGKRERFISVHSLDFMYTEQPRRVWLSLSIFADDLTRLGVSHRRLLAESGLRDVFSEVRTTESVDGRRLLRFEQITPVPYVDYPADCVHLVVAGIRMNLWTAVGSASPYRHYYLYLSPPRERRARLPQLLSIYAIFFYLGSITRYRPHHFDKILASVYGPRVEEFITGQPNQFVYMMASEFVRREVTRPAIV
jgi:hypothetical protein